MSILSPKNEFVNLFDKTCLVDNAHHNARVVKAFDCRRVDIIEQRLKEGGAFAFHVNHFQGGQNE